MGCHGQGYDDASDQISFQAISSISGFRVPTLNFWRKWEKWWSLFDDASTSTLYNRCHEGE